VPGSVETPSTIGIRFSLNPPREDQEVRRACRCLISGGGEGFSAAVWKEEAADIKKAAAFFKTAALHHPVFIILIGTDYTSK